LPQETTRASAAWCELTDADTSDAIVAALAQGGVEVVFFTSASEMVFVQEAIAKARAFGRPAPRLVTVTHEHANLCAALGYAAVSGKPVATAVHVDAGTLHQGGAIHNAMHAGLPVLMTAGFPPTSYAGTSRAARNAGGHLWLQETYDQHSIVRQYVKWDHHLTAHDNPGLTVSRALQVATSEPCGPVYLSIPPEVSMSSLAATRFPTAEQLGLARPPAPDPVGAREIAERLVHARNPRVVVSGAGRNPEAVPALVSLCELLGLPVVHSKSRCYLSFPMDHPLMLADGDLSGADVVLVLEADVPWIPGPTAPGPQAWIAAVALDPVKRKFPTYEFTADLRLTADPLLALRAIEAAARPLIDATIARRCAARARETGETTRARRAALSAQIAARASTNPIDPLWLGQRIGALIDDNSIVIDDTLPHNRFHEFLPCRRPGSYFFTPGTSGGWAPGAAFGAKLAAPERDVIAVTGDGFYMFGTATAALWSAAHYRAPYLTVIYQNRSYITGTVRVANVYPDGYSQKSGFDGGYFDPPMDFAKEAEAAGAYGENVRDPAELDGALQRALAQVRSGKPAVVAVWLPRHLQSD
jgi:acetolactate synthase I/II/III large subunit